MVLPTGNLESSTSDISEVRSTKSPRTSFDMSSGLCKGTAVSDWDG